MVRSVPCPQCLQSGKAPALGELIDLRARAAWGRDHSSTPRSKPTPAATAAFRGHNSNRGAQFLSSAALLGSGTAVLLDVGLYCFLAVASGVNYMTRRDMSVVRRCFMMSSLVMLCSFLMMARRMH
jgi:hypothetical protein